MGDVTIERKWAEMSHGRTRYFEAGEGPDVLLLHGAGFTSGGHGWLPVLSGLGEHFHCYAPDSLGFGPGDPIAQPYSFAYLVDHLREFEDVVGVEHSHVIGHSMGGWLGVLLAYESPDRVDRFIDVAGGGVVTRPLASMVAWQPPEDDAVRASMKAIEHAPYDVAGLVEERIGLAHDEVRTASFRRLMDHMSDPETRQRYNTARRLRRIKAPTLVLWGADDAINAVELGEQTRDLLPNGELVVFDGVGHFVPQEAPERFVSTVVEFLER